MREKANYLCVELFSEEVYTVGDPLLVTFPQNSLFRFQTSSDGAKSFRFFR